MVFITPTELVDIPEDSPMDAGEVEILRAAEARMASAYREHLKAEIRQGLLLDDLKHHPRLLWQRDEMFRTKNGGWKKKRDWHQFVVQNNLAESGKEADRLIQLWRDHQMHLAAAEVS